MKKNAQQARLVKENVPQAIDFFFASSLQDSHGL